MTGTAWWRLTRDEARHEGRALAGSGVLTVLTILVTLALPWPLALAVDHALGDLPAPGALVDWSARSLLLLAGVATVALTAASGLLDSAAAAVGERAAERIGARLRSRTFARSLRLSLSWHGRTPRGELVSRLTSDTGRVVDSVIAVTSTLVPELLALVAVLGVLVVLDPVLALVGCAVIPALAQVAVQQRRALRAAQQQARTAAGAASGTATELLKHVPAVQAFGREDLAEAGFEEHNAALLSADLHTVTTEARWMPRADIVLSLGTGMVLVQGGLTVLAGEQTVGHLIVVVAYLRELYAPVRALTRLSTTLARAEVSAERLLDVVDSTDRIPESPTAVRLDVPAAELELDGVWFGYDPHDPVLRGLDLHVAPGETVVVVGPNGVGKSTLLRLLLRLYDVSGGVVRVAGHDVRDLTLASLRHHVAYVPQDAWLVDGSLGDNIAFGSPTATPERIRAAAATAGVDALAASLPQGYETPLQEGGARLSGGQQRRVALARALVSDAPVLLLDEPTASLDEAAVAEVVQAIRTAAQGRTTLLVTHDERLHPLADRVVTLRRETGLPSPPATLDDTQPVRAQPAPGPLMVSIGRR